jgi:hypothetical protein
LPFDVDPEKIVPIAWVEFNGQDYFLMAFAYDESGRLANTGETLLNLFNVAGKAMVFPQNRDEETLSLNANLSDFSQGYSVYLPLFLETFVHALAALHIENGWLEP